MMLDSGGLPMRVVVLAVVISGVALGQSNPRRSASLPILELRLASGTRTSTFTVRHEQSTSDQPKVLFLASGNIVSDMDLVRARTRPAPDGIVVEIVLSDAAAARLRQVTANNIGKYLTIFSYGRFAGSATIMGAVPRGNKVTVGLTLPPTTADSVRSAIATRWLAPPQ